MYYQREKSGFTLLEIIVVLIIVGVLAAIALPALFGNIEKSRTMEATENIGNIRTLMEACYQKDPTKANTNCVAANIISGSNGSSPNFTTYAVTTMAASVPSYAITATATFGRGTVTLVQAAPGNSTCTGTGSYAGGC